MWPGFHVLYQIRPHGILPDIISLELQSFLWPDAMIEVVFLPDNAGSPRGKSFPITDRFCLNVAFGESSYQVQVVGHEKKDMQGPVLLGVIENSVL